MKEQLKHNSYSDQLVNRDLGFERGGWNILKQCIMAEFNATVALLRFVCHATPSDTFNWWLHGGAWPGYKSFQLAGGSLYSASQ